MGHSNEQTINLGKFTEPVSPLDGSRSKIKPKQLTARANNGKLGGKANFRYKRQIANTKILVAP
jgi:hypothetical protein